MQRVFVACCLLGPGQALACPVCESETGQQIRAGIFDERFGRNVLLVLSPFPVLAALGAALHVGFSRRAP
jgi:hypothetical protein